MSPISTIALAAAATVLLGSTAMAADLMAPPPPDVAMTSSSDWTGGYIGISGNYDQGDYINLQGVLGAQFQTGGFVFGGELAYGPYYGFNANSGNNGAEGYLAGKVGFASDAVLIYGLLGVSDVDGFIGRVAGGGLEFKLADNVGLRGQVVEYFDPSWSASFTQVGAGVMFHF